MRYKTIAAALFGCFAILATPVLATAKEAAVDFSTINLETLALRLDESDSEFMLIDARMDETATAGVFFGLVGAAVNSAANGSEDAKKAEPYQPTAAALDVDKLVIDALHARLAAKDIRLVSDPAAAKNTLVVSVGEWGLARKAQKPDTDMRVFLKLNLTLLDARGRVVSGPQREHSIGQLTAPLSSITPEAFKAEMETVAQRAGQSIANKLIYR